MSSKTIAYGRGFRGVFFTLCSLNTCFPTAYRKGLQFLPSSFSFLPPHSLPLNFHSLPFPSRLSSLSHSFSLFQSETLYFILSISSLYWVYSIISVSFSLFHSISSWDSRFSLSLFHSLFLAMFYVSLIHSLIYDFSCFFFLFLFLFLCFFLSIYPSIFLLSFYLSLSLSLYIVLSLSFCLFVFLY